MNMDDDAEPTELLARLGKILAAGKLGLPDGAEASRLMGRFLVATLGPQVRRGPFQGLDVGAMVSPAAYLLGSYEEELQPWLNALIAADRWDVVANIGCGDGYYAAGLAQRLRRARVHAFEADEAALRRTRATTERNGVADRVVCGGRCEVETLRALLNGPALLLVDCEGGETELLDPRRLPDLTSATMLVEIHDFIDATISATLTHRFQASHRLLRVASRQRDPGAYPELADMPAPLPDLCLQEFRPDMEWFLLVPHAEPWLQGA